VIEARENIRVAYPLVSAAVQFLLLPAALRCTAVDGNQTVARAGTNAIGRHWIAVKVLLNAAVQCHSPATLRRARAQDHELPWIPSTWAMNWGCWEAKAPQSPGQTQWAKRGMRLGM